MLAVLMEHVIQKNIQGKFNTKFNDNNHAYDGTEVLAGNKNFSLDPYLQEGEDGTYF